MERLNEVTMNIEFNIHDRPKTLQDVQKIRLIVHKQQTELLENNIVTCPCKKQIPVRVAYRCYMCGIIFCPKCAEDHFGKRSQMWYVY